jgi:hypothetical protein
MLVQLLMVLAAKLPRIEAGSDSDFMFLTLGYASATANIYGDIRSRIAQVHLTES